jgi:hypothetical protein
VKKKEHSPTNEHALVILPKRSRVSLKKEEEKYRREFKSPKILACWCCPDADADAVVVTDSGGTMPFLILKFIVRLNEWNYAFPLSPIHRFFSVLGCLNTCGTQLNYATRPRERGFNCCTSFIWVAG